MQTPNIVVILVQIILVMRLHRRDGEERRKVLYRCQASKIIKNIKRTQEAVNISLLQGSLLLKEHPGHVFAFYSIVW